MQRANSRVLNYEELYRFGEPVLPNIPPIRAILALVDLGKPSDYLSRQGIFHCRGKYPGNLFTPDSRCEDHNIPTDEQPPAPHVVGID